MIKNKLGELKLSPIKEDGKFVFCNDFITINGKVAKGDWIKIFVQAYDQAEGKYNIKSGVASAIFTVRGQEEIHHDDHKYATVEDYYEHLTELYRQQFYFGKKTEN